METNESRRKFLKYGFVGMATLFAAAAPVHFDNSKNFLIGKMPVPSAGLAEAQAACGTAYSCSGGGGSCGTAYSCSGGGGRCGTSYNCSGS